MMDNPRLRDLCVRYYRDLTDLGALREQETAVRSEIETLTAIAAEPQQYASQGVSNYAAAARSQRKADPTPRIAAQHHRETGDIRERIRGLRRELAEIQRRINQLLVSTLPITSAIAVMTPQDRRIIELRWGPHSTRNSTIATIAEQLDCDSSTVVRRLQWLESRVPKLLERSLVVRRDANA
jgi:hypothetical protein